MERDIHIHIHEHLSGRGARPILARLTSMEETMSNLTDAVDGLTAAVATATTRIDEDVAHLQDLLAQALVTNTTNAAEVARLTAEGEAAVASITATTSTLAAIDPLTDFPAAV